MPKEKILKSLPFGKAKIYIHRLKDEYSQIYSDSRINRAIDMHTKKYIRALTKKEKY